MVLQHLRARARGKGRVNENLETIFEFSRWREINESIVAGVIAAGEAGDAPHSSAQTEINSPVDFDAKIRIADDELKRGIVRAAREKFLGCRRALRVREIQPHYPNDSPGNVTFLT